MTYARLTRNAPWVRIVWILLAIVAVILLSRIITRTAGGDDFDFSGAAITNTWPVVSNIVESSSVVTNVGPMVNNAVASYSMMEKHGYTIGCLVYGCAEDHDHVSAVIATERTQTTTVKRIDTLKFNWRNRPWTARIETVLRETVRKWKLNEEWKEVQE